MLSAVGEVQGNLTRNHYQEQKIAALNQQLDVTRASLKQAQISYMNSQTSYINVLDSLINAQNLELELLKAQLDQALYRVALYRALGLDGWTDRFVRLQDDEDEIYWD